MTGAWSNDQLNELYIYDPVTGQLILSITNTGFYYVVGEATYLIDAQGLKARLTADNGAYASLIPRTAYNGARLELRPGNYPPAATTWPYAGFASAGYDVVTGPNYAPFTVLSSPGLSDNSFVPAQLTLFGQATGGVSRSLAYLYAEEFVGVYQQQIGLGNLIVVPATASFSYNFTSTTDVVAYSLNAVYFGTGFKTNRAYEGEFAGTLRSSTAGDRIGLRLYRGPTFGSLVGATLVADYGQVSAAVAAVDQPFGSIKANFNGVTTDGYFMLAVRRASGAGNCNVTIRHARLADQCPLLP